MLIPRVLLELALLEKNNSFANLVFKFICLCEAYDLQDNLILILILYKLVTQIFISLFGYAGFFPFVQGAD